MVETVEKSLTLIKQFQLEFEMRIFVSFSKTVKKAPSFGI